MSTPQKMHQAITSCCDTVRLSLRDNFVGLSLLISLLVECLLLWHSRDLRFLLGKKLLFLACHVGKKAINLGGLAQLDISVEGVQN